MMITLLALLFLGIVLYVRMSAPISSRTQTSGTRVGASAGYHCGILSSSIQEWRGPKRV